MVSFPASPTVNQQIPGPGGQVWQWDGDKWVGKSAWLNPDAPADGYQYARANGVWQVVSMAKMPGITDGSVAVPGEVGESLTQTTTLPLSDLTAWQTLLTLPLPPGDWQLNASFRNSFNANDGRYVAVCTSLSPNAQTNPDDVPFSVQVWLGANIAQWGAAVPSRPINTATALTVYLNGFAYNGAGNGSSMFVFLQARRMR